MKNEKDALVRIFIRESRYEYINIQHVPKVNFTLQNRKFVFFLTGLEFLENLFYNEVCGIEYTSDYFSKNRLVGKHYRMKHTELKKGY